MLSVAREWPDVGVRAACIGRLHEVTSLLRASKICDNQVYTSISILHFENQKCLAAQMEKFVQRSLWMRYEQLNKDVDNSKSDAETGYQLSKTPFNGFLSFFQPVSSRDPESFKTVIQQNCEIKTVKKQNVPSQDQALIRLKDTAFNEVKKQVQKERGSIKQFSKLFDFSNDKTLKTQSKTSKKAMLQLLSDSQQQGFQTII